MENKEKSGSYLKFVIMILTSMAVMFAVMYLHTYQVEHIRWSETRFYMTLLMGASMGVVMLSFMLGMYKDKKSNFMVYVSSIALFGLAVWLVRSQSLVDDSSYMRAMIPHHSIAILTSERAQIKDVRVRKLADEIIKAQRREIKEMDWLIDDIASNGVVSFENEKDGREVPDFEGKP